MTNKETLTGYGLMPDDETWGGRSCRDGQVRRASLVAFRRCKGARVLPDARTSAAPAFIRTILRRYRHAHRATCLDTRIFVRQAHRTSRCRVGYSAVARTAG